MVPVSDARTTDPLSCTSVAMLKCWIESHSLIKHVTAAEGRPSHALQEGVQSHLLSSFCDKARLQGTKCMQQSVLFAMQSAHRPPWLRCEVRLKAPQ